MKIIAYLYSDPLFELPPQSDLWGVEIDHVYQDLGKRQALKQLQLDCQKFPPDYLLIRRLEELGDSINQIQEIIQAIEALGVEIIALEQSYRSSEFNNDSLTGLRDNLVQLVQNIQAAQNCRRLRQGHARNRIKGLPPPGKAPYGYRRGKDRYILDRSTAPVIKDFFERFLLFGSLRGAVRYLEQKYGKKISVSTGRRWLTSPVYRGNLLYHKDEVLPATHVPILSEEEAAQIDRLLRRNSRLSPRTASAPRSLAGLVVCQSCQSSMKVTRVTRRGKKQEYLYLRPINCLQTSKCSAIPYKDVLDVTIERICDDLPEAVAKMNAPDIDNVKNRLLGAIAEKKEILAQLPRLKNQGILDEETADLRSYKVRTEIAQLEAKIAQLPPVNLSEIVQTVSLQQFWLDLSESERRFYFREFIQRIELIRGDHKDWQLKLIFIF